MNEYMAPIVKILDFSVLSLIPYNDENGEGSGGTGFSGTGEGHGQRPR
jgi:hypothetical protein